MYVQTSVDIVKRLCWDTHEIAISTRWAEKEEKGTELWQEWSCCDVDKWPGRRRPIWHHNCHIRVAVRKRCQANVPKSCAQRRKLRG